MSDLPLHRGSAGPDVVEIQKLLGMTVDGDFGPSTETAIKAFQRAIGLEMDGVVGDETWTALHKLPPIEAPSEHTPLNVGAIDVAEITEIVGKHKVARYNWPGRGRAPVGYTKGVAISFAVAVLGYRAEYLPALAMARAASHSDMDALHWYNDRFVRMGMSNSNTSVDTLRHLFVLLLGLGMRESSGRHCCGRDMSARNTSSTTCEAGAWQMSWDAHAGVPLLQRLMNDYKGDGYADVYDEGVKCSKAEWRCLGDGIGHSFQLMCKNKPDFAAQACALGMRTLRPHWGPLNRKQATLAPGADDMLQQVQDTLSKVTPVPVIAVADVRS